MKKFRVLVELKIDQTMGVHYIDAENAVEAAKIAQGMHTEWAEEHCQGSTLHAFVFSPDGKELQCEEQVAQITNAGQKPKIEDND